MNKKNESSKNKLSLNLFEANLKRHPSVKCLFDEDGKKKTSQKSNNELLLLNIDNKNEKENKEKNNGNGEEEESYEKKKIKELEKEIEKIENEKRRKQNKQNKEKKEKRTMSVQINRVEEKMVDNKDTFFVEMSEEERKEILKKKFDQKKSSKFLIKPLKYGFNEEQEEFDKSITEAISIGKDYNEIEKKFSDLLKKSNNNK